MPSFDIKLPGRFTPQQAADLAEIQQRLYFYGWCIDHRRFEDLDELFLPESIVHYDTPGGTRGPWSEIRTWLPRLNVFRATQHNMHNPIVVFDESGDRAASTTYGYLIHFQETKEGGIRETAPARKVRSTFKMCEVVCCKLIMERAWDPGVPAFAAPGGVGKR